MERWWILVFLGLAVYVGLRALTAIRARWLPKHRWQYNPGNTVEIVGESNFQEALFEYCGGYAKDGHNLKCHAVLIPEDDNDFDECAVRVEIHKRPVGYLSEERAIQYRHILKELDLEGKPIACAATIDGGWDRGDGKLGCFGVKLSMTWPPQLMA